MRPPFDGIPPPQDIWSPEMKDWIQDCQDRSELTLFEYYQQGPFSALKDRICSLVQQYLEPLRPH